MQKIYLLFTFILITPIMAVSQNDKKIFEVAQKKFAAITINYETSDGKLTHSLGSGFLINKDYVATCYHVYKGEPTLKILNASIQCNIKNESGNYSYETIEIDTEYKATGNQYDFKKHIYNKEDFTTDFIILKLKKPATFHEIEFAESKINIGDPIYAVGFVKGLVSTRDKILSWFKENKNSKEFYLMSIGFMQHGYSGSAVFNSEGKVVGMCQRGVDTLPLKEYKKDFEGGLIGKDVYDEIINGHKAGKTIGYSININYLRNKYMSGYIDKLP